MQVMLPLNLLKKTVYSPNLCRRQILEPKLNVIKYSTVRYRMIIMNQPDHHGDNCLYPYTQAHGTVAIYPYPLGSTNTVGNFYGSLSAVNEVALQTMESWAADPDKNIDLSVLLNATPRKEIQTSRGDAVGYVPQYNKLVLLRYLRANGFDTSKAMQHIVKNIAWRQEMGVSEIVEQLPEDILGCKMSELTAVFPHWQTGYDKTGRPVLYKQYGKFDATTVKKLTGGTFDNIIKYHVWEQEACGRLCEKQSKNLRNTIETISGLIDVKDMQLSQITRDFLNLTKMLAEIDQKQYPETLGRMFIINVPSVFPFVWRMVKPWIDPATAAKISIFAGPKEYEPVLKEFIGEENLPSNYGGSGPALSTSIHPYAETMLEYGGATEISPSDDSISPAVATATAAQAGPTTVKSPSAGGEEGEEGELPEWAAKTPELQRIDNVIEELEQQPELGEPSMCGRVGLHGAILQDIMHDTKSRYAIRRTMEWQGIDLNIVDTSSKDGYVSYEIAVYSPERRWTVHRRFRDFFFLDKQLRKFFNRVSLPQLPPRRFLKNEKTPGFVEERRDLLEAYLQRLVKIQPIWGRNDIVLFLDSEVSHMPAKFQLSYGSSNGGQPANRRASLSTMFRSASVDDSSPHSRKSLPSSTLKRRSFLGMLGVGNRNSTSQEDGMEFIQVPSSKLLGNGSESLPSEVDASHEPPVEASPVIVASTSTPDPTPATLTRRSSVRRKEPRIADDSGDGDENGRTSGEDSIAANLAHSQFSMVCTVGIYLILFLMALALLNDLIKFVFSLFK